VCGVVSKGTADLCFIYRISDCEQQQLYASVPQFYDFLQNRVLVTFRPKFEEPSATNPEFECMLSKKMTYELVSPIHPPWCNLNLTWQPRYSRWLQESETTFATIR
jgi:hypothetical protein